MDKSRGTPSTSGSFHSLRLPGGRKLRVRANPFQGLRSVKPGNEVIILFLFACFMGGQESPVKIVVGCETLLRTN